MKLKFVVRRFFAGLLTLPLALAGYFVLYALLVMLGTGPVGSWHEPVNNFPMIAVAWMLLWVFLPKVIQWAFRD